MITLHSELWYLAPGISEMRESATEGKQVPVEQFLLSERFNQIYSFCGAPQLPSTRMGLVERSRSSLLEKPSCLPLPLMRFFEEHPPDDAQCVQLHNQQGLGSPCVPISHYWSSTFILHTFLFPQHFI